MLLKQMQNILNHSSCFLQYTYHNCKVGKKVVTANYEDKLLLIINFNFLSMMHLK